MTSTSSDQNKQIVRRAIAEAVNAHDLEAFRATLAPDYQRHSQATTDMPEIRGVDQMLTFVQAIFAALPDWHEEIELIIAEGDKVALITTGTGTHTGPLGAIPPTGRSIRVTNFIVQRIESGKIAETWIGWDNLAMLSQLGLAPTPTLPTEPPIIQRPDCVELHGTVRDAVGPLGDGRQVLRPRSAT